ncbi:unnamed protein product [Oppiella nova]|uniref:C2H2-type domain-containing protein n=1 Tax=Oppiella nova TaxID=334625 RepID=A0A7R9QDM0_9ACAR|nr:unnamed protein product [Oppiella nova]CAG2163733.1 unnamed protein product [Oppiella nova]
MDAHMNVHSGVKPYQCTHEGCVQRFISNYKRWEHMCADHINGCDYECRDKYQLEAHINKHNGVRPYKCTQPGCGQLFCGRKVLESHTLSHITSPESCVCDYVGCGKEFSNRHLLIRHQKKHRNTHKIKCNVSGCEYKSQHKSQMEAHMNRHKGVRPYQCPHEWCGKWYGSKDVLHAHTRDVHSANEPCVCDYSGCNKVFNTPNLLRQHKVTHTSVGRKHKCPEPGCGAAYRTIGTLSHHKLSQHSGRVLTCQWAGCEFTTRYTSQLRRHRFKHSGGEPAKYVCEWPGCEFRTPIKVNLDNHRTTHTDIRAHVCDWPHCDKAFKTAHGLRQHMITHSSVMLSCDRKGCPFQTKDKQTLRKHKKSRHNDDN